MMKKTTNSPAISDVVSVILVIALVLVLAMVVYVLLFGSIDQKYLKKSVYVAGSAQQTGIQTSTGVAPYQLLTFLPKAGDPFYLTGQTTHSGTQTTMRIISPDGRNISPDASTLTGSLYGKQLYIYPLSTANECQYSVTDKVPDVKTLPKMVTGRYQIMLIDENVHLVADSYTTDITQGTTALPRTVLAGTITAGASYRADCSQTGGTCGGSGCPPVSNKSPCNTTYSTFSGSNYLTFPNDPTLQYTGDTTIAVMIQPTTIGSYSSSDTTNWHQIIGKGVTNGVDDESDNYQLFQMGDRLYFEWNDASTGIHYQAMTPTGTIQSTANRWNQINVVVQNGQLAIYDNGIPQKLSYYQSNVPEQNSLTAVQMAAIGVHLKDTVSNDVTIGKQNGNPPCYFNGNIGAISLYDRALSQTEITNNQCSG
jgi:FlaG/FlaF family flagellin (archaellin)